MIDQKRNLFGVFHLFGHIHFSTDLFFIQSSNLSLSSIIHCNTLLLQDDISIYANDFHKWQSVNRHYLLQAFSFKLKKK